MIVLHIIASIALVAFAAVYGLSMAAATQEGCRSILRYVIPGAIVAAAVAQWWI